MTERKYPNIELSNISVMCVTSGDGVKGSGDAFKTLESKLPTLKRRKFYGVLSDDPENGVYRACVQTIPEDNAKELGLDTWTIPGGKYTKAVIENWEEHTDQIGPTLHDMAHMFQTDDTRPVIEFYRSQKELILYLPIS